MSSESLFLLFSAVLVVSFLYSSIGHAGASGYVAVMALFDFLPSTIRTTALVLNILVAIITAWQFWKAGHFSWRLFFPFALASIPFAFLGGCVFLPGIVLEILLGVVLLFSSLRFFIHGTKDIEPHQISNSTAFSVGAGLGFLSGVTGVGGGIFLTPLMIFMRWTRVKTASAVSALFILVNSVAGLIGSFSRAVNLSFIVIPLALLAAAGGVAGSYLGSRRFSPNVIRKILAVVLLIAGLKLIAAR